MNRNHPRTTMADVSVSTAERTSLSDNTRRAYRAAWRRFRVFCDELGKDPLAATPQDVASFVVNAASAPRPSTASPRKGEPLALGTIRIALAAINRTYRDRRLPSPAGDPHVVNVLRGLGRLRDERPRQVRALGAVDLQRMLTHCDDLSRQPRYRIKAARDAAVLAIGFAGALRRSEICNLRFSDAEFVEQRGMLLRIRRSKTDQGGQGQTIAIPEGTIIRPAERVKNWLNVSGIAAGPLFQTLRRGGSLRGRMMHSSDVARLVKRYVEIIGLDPAEYSGHSLRAGFVTSAAAHGARLDKIMEVTRHSNPGTVLRYIRQESAFEDHAGAAFL